MNLFTIGLAILNLIQTPEITPPDIYKDTPTCAEHNLLIASATSNRCNTFEPDKFDYCNEFDKELATRSPEGHKYIHNLETQCIQEMLYTSKMQYKEVNCKNPYLYGQRKELCTSLRTNIKDLNSMLKINQKNKKE